MFCILCVYHTVKCFLLGSHIPSSSADLESDDFQKETRKCFQKMIQIKNNRFLVVDEEVLKFKERNKEQCKADDCRFNIQQYKNNDISKANGIAVILSVTSPCKQTYMVCCKNGDQGVSAKPLEQPLPDQIRCSKHEAVFFMEVIPGTSQYRFKSSLRTSSYLSFEAGPDAELIKLVLREVPQDVVDENTIMRLQAC
uniref:Interleukin-18 n=1 Tax=Oncorhynchus tshawytscha TaxID=74940 RepID=A0A8C8LNZ7_ONCTS